MEKVKDKAEFPCTSCGHCCKDVGQAIRAAQEKDYDPVLKQELISFPFEVLKNGTCSQLKKDGSCGVYQDRPLLCNVEKTYDKYFATVMSREEFYLSNMKACNDLMNKHREGRRQNTIEFKNLHNLK